MLSWLWSSERHEDSDDPATPATTNDFGLQVLFEPTPSPDLRTSPIDIIFVHGLGGSAKGTWTHPDSKSFWPLWLPKVNGLENARITVFGYDSAWNKIWKPNNVLDISNFADQFLNALRRHYSRYGNSPTILVAHSMGGLVVKKALINAHNLGQKYAHIGINVLGIAFLGTPHRGADLAGVLKAVLTVSFSTRKFVNDLSKTSQTIQELNRLFGARAEQLELVSFWESTGMPVVGVVVPESSATLGYPGEEALALNGDHSTIVKYHSETDNNYKVVSETLSLLLQDATRKDSRVSQNPVPALILTSVDSVADSSNKTIQPTPSSGNFLGVPYQRNPFLKGRTDFLELLKDKLSEESPSDKFNHRVALHGLGGVGKTQCALEYVYANRERYQRIYWISAADRTSLLSGYQNIANCNQLQLPGMQEASTAVKAQMVLSWLKGQENWLLVIDNLDNIKVADGLLPENGPRKHTIITTRNPRTTGIPAEPLEVPLLSPDDSVALLSALSKVDIQPGSKDGKRAHEIVKELGYLPLAIDLAACYVRDIAGGFSEYWKRYKLYRERLHRWVPDGNRQYSDSVATAWSLSFDLIQKDKNATYLLRLFSTVNPDKILMEFLIAGMTAIQDDPGNDITDEHDLSVALLELENFSLIKWDRQSHSLSIHRLVQTVIRDKMSDEELTSTHATFVKLCIEVFPGTTNNETRALCRKYENQVVQPLLRLNTILSQEAAYIKRTVGAFLMSDGKYADSVALLRQGLEIQISVSGDEHPETLATMHLLAVTYMQQGHSAKAQALGEEVLEKRRRILGGEHPETLAAMHLLTVTYCEQGLSAKAQALGEEVLKKRRRILGEEHPETLTTMHLLASTYGQRGRLKDACTLQEEVLRKRKDILGKDHPDTLLSMRTLVELNEQQGRSDEKLEEEADSLEISHWQGDKRGVEHVNNGKPTLK